MCWRIEWMTIGKRYPWHENLKPIAGIAPDQVRMMNLGIEWPYTPKGTPNPRYVKQVSCLMMGKEEVDAILITVEKLFQQIVEITDEHHGG